MATRAKRAPKAPTTEREIRRYFVREVKKNGGTVRKVNWQGRRSAPDELAMFPEVEFACFVELKAPGKEPTKAQHQEIRELRAAGLNATWLNSYEDVDNFLAWHLA